VIPIQHDLSEIKYLVSHSVDFARVFAAKPLAPFCDEVLTFLNSLSSQLMQDPKTRAYPDVFSFAFWCRLGALRAIKKDYGRAEHRLGRGIVFHIAPSNVPVNFAYSLAVGLLAGNINIVRLPGKDFQQIELICDALNIIIARDEFASLRDHIILLKYDKNDAITDFFSRNCDVRVIWGGDQTIGNIRRSHLSPRAYDLTFADRYSLCVINAEQYLKNIMPARIARDFYNDTYLFDQNACTAPHLIIWIGEIDDVIKAKKAFWEHLHAVVSEKYLLPEIAAINKLTSAYFFAATNKNCYILNDSDNLIVRIQLDSLKIGVEKARSTCGYFLEYQTKNFDEIASIINRKFQTLAYYGVKPEQLQRFMENNRPKGIDRIVPIGRTLDFTLMWDGYDLVSMLSRLIALPKFGIQS